VSRNSDTLTGDLKLAGFGGDKRAVPTDHAITVRAKKGKETQRSSKLFEGNNRGKQTIGQAESGRPA